jgi:hypothetical protein
VVNRAADDIAKARAPVAAAGPRVAQPGAAAAQGERTMLEIAALPAEEAVARLGPNEVEQAHKLGYSAVKVGNSPGRGGAT